MATLVLTCSAPDCDMGLRVPIKTPDMPSGDALEVLKMHREDCHPTAVAAAVQGGQSREVRPQAARLKRPTLALSGQSINQEEYDHFHSTSLGSTRSGSGTTQTTPPASSSVSQ
jgi:hypothetical protein